MAQPKGSTCCPVAEYEARPRLTCCHLTVTGTPPSRHRLFHPDLINSPQQPRRRHVPAGPRWLDLIRESK